MNCNEFLTQLYAEMRGKDKTYKNLRDAIVKVSERNYAPSEFSFEKREDERLLQENQNCGQRATTPMPFKSRRGVTPTIRAMVRRFLDDEGRNV